MPRGRSRKRAGSGLVRSAELIGWAIGGIEREITETRNRLAALTAQAAKLRKRAGRRAGQVVADVAAAVQPARGRRRRTMSAAGRARIAAAARRRWAKWR